MVAVLAVLAQQEATAEEEEATAGTAAPAEAPEAAGAPVKDPA